MRLYISCENYSQYSRRFCLCISVSAYVELASCQMIHFLQQRARARDSNTTNCRGKVLSNRFIILKCSDYHNKIGSS